MYHPYFRGKQYELVTIRESARLLKEAGFVPIIEPVRQSTNGLERALNEVRDSGGDCVLIINPQYGDHVEDDTALWKLLEGNYSDFSGLSAGILLGEDVTVEGVRTLCRKLDGREVALIHCGLSKGRALARESLSSLNVTRHIFIEKHCGKLYRRHFSEGTRVLVSDGFNKRRKNSEYPSVEHFSDLHVTFTEEGMTGFGDFLVVGDDYFDSGGPAYAVAIHLTFIDTSGDGAMSIYHFVSDRTETQSDPAGKFREALMKLLGAVETAGSQIVRTDAVKRFMELHRDDHYPGLGYIKKLSMQHHIETLADYFASR